MSDEVEVVCLVGSSRFKEAFQREGERLEKAGCLVLAMSFFQHSDGVSVSDAEREVLERVDRKRIDMANEVLVLNCLRPRCKVCWAWMDSGDPDEDCDCGRLPLYERRKRHIVEPYVGESTRKEIAYATAKGKPVRYLIDPVEASR